MVYPKSILQNIKQLLEPIAAEDRAWLSGHSAAVQLGRAVLLACMHDEGRFPNQAQDVSVVVVEYLAQQLGLAAGEFAQYDWSGRRGQMDREVIRERLGFWIIRREDHADLARWLSDNQLLHETHEMGDMRKLMLDHLRGQGIEPPSAKQLDRLIRTGLYEFEVRLFQNTSERLPAKSKLALDALVYTDDAEGEYRRSDIAELKMDACDKIFEEKKSAASVTQTLPPLRRLGELE